MIDPPLTLIDCLPTGTREWTNAATGEPTMLPEYDRTRGEALRTLRVEQGKYLRQVEAAKLCGLEPRDYSALESGRKTLSSEDWERVFAAVKGGKGDG